MNSDPMTKEWTVAEEVKQPLFHLFIQFGSHNL